MPRLHFAQPRNEEKENQDGNTEPQRPDDDDDLALPETAGVNDAVFQPLWTYALRGMPNLPTEQREEMLNQPEAFDWCSSYEKVSDEIKEGLDSWIEDQKLSYVQNNEIRSND